ncbi:MAG: membrane lipoprotein lipid attachment site-containing protein, partial [Paludibacteraceae bacterium]|nr:membrane lipoprotein lipid attachment site-containing protein [Paludibacteraceae bacterium]
MKKYVFFIFLTALLTGCNKPSKVEQFRAEKHLRDSSA